jgi:phospho-N-acetylmuramoyl-pentapeptide-transferase
MLLGAVERAGGTHDALGAGAGGAGFLRRLREHSKQSGGGTPRVKLIARFALAAFVGFYLWNLPAKSELCLPKAHGAFEIYKRISSTLMLPFYKYPIHVGAIAGVIIVALAIVGSSNAVNLTDGLDGLATGCTSITGFVF